MTIGAAERPAERRSQPEVAGRPRSPVPLAERTPPPREEIAAEMAVALDRAKARFYPGPRDADAAKASR